MTAALAEDSAHLAAVRHFVDQHRARRGARPPIPVHLPDDPRVRALNVRPHNLTDYEQLTRKDSHERLPEALGRTRPRRSPPLEVLRARLKRLNLYGLLAQAEQIRNEPWLARVLEIEESERQSRSLKRRFGNARLLKFKSIADFDYAWPKKIDRELLEELLTLDFLEQAANVILVGPNGVGKTMIAKNLLHQAILQGLQRSLRRRLRHAA